MSSIIEQNSVSQSAPLNSTESHSTNLKSSLYLKKINLSTASRTEKDLPIKTRAIQTAQVIHSQEQQPQYQLQHIKQHQDQAQHIQEQPQDKPQDIKRQEQEPPHGNQLPKGQAQVKAADPAINKKEDPQTDIVSFNCNISTRG